VSGRGGERELRPTFWVGREAVDWLSVAGEIIDHGAGIRAPNLHHGEEGETKKRKPRYLHGTIEGSGAEMKWNFWMRGARTSWCPANCVNLFFMSPKIMRQAVLNSPYLQTIRSRREGGGWQRKVVKAADLGGAIIRTGGEVLSSRRPAHRVDLIFVSNQSPNGSGLRGGDFANVDCPIR
jgi:hypothetical protein